MDLLTVALLLTTMLLLPYWFINSGNNCKNLPPGPRTLPLIGNLLQLWGRDLRDVCMEYRKGYGDMFTLYFFNQIIIFVNGLEAIKDIGVKHGDVFSHRPKLKIFKEIMKGEGIIFSSGDTWKYNRRFAIRTLRDFGMGKSKLQTRIHEELDYFLNAIEQKREQSFDIEYLITIAVSNIMCTIVYGKRFDYTDKTFLDIAHRAGEVFEANVQLKPLWLRYIPGDPFKMEKSYQNLKHLDNFHRTKIREHMQDFDANNLRDVIDVYIKQMKENEASTNEDEIVRIVHDLFVGGTETVSTSQRFALIFMMRHPEIQEKIANELLSLVPNNRLPDIEDIKRLPLVPATISEVLRRGCIGPFTGVHVAEIDQQYCGFEIPKSALLLFSLESVLLDAAMWENPLEFNPDRFLDKDNLLIEKKELIPFGLGPRICPGESMAKMELNLFFASMLYRFKFLSPEEGPPDLASKLGATAVSLPFKLRAMKRF